MLVSLARAVAWYFENVYGRFEGPNVLPWYCDPTRCGNFAIDPGLLASGDADALFRLFIGFSMFQARRDTVILAQQRAMTDHEVDALASAPIIERLVSGSSCTALSSTKFVRACTVALRNNRVDCHGMPGRRCHVKDATRALKRTGDMGKVPSSAWIHAWAGDKLAEVLEMIKRAPAADRGDSMVNHFSGVHRVGRKLATMFVSALSTPALAPGLTPWFPLIDGNQLLVIDTNVARALDTLGCPHKTYQGRAMWLHDLAQHIDLSGFHPEVPPNSPRLVQQALFAFCSRSNRSSRLDACAERTRRCDECVPDLCPFVPKSLPTGRTRTR